MNRYFAFFSICGLDEILFDLSTPLRTGQIERGRQSIYNPRNRLPILT